jgi:pyruvate kinase
MGEDAHPFAIMCLQEMHQLGFDNVKKASKATRTLCATMMDTLGPEIVVINR